MNDSFTFVKVADNWDEIPDFARGAEPIGAWGQITDCAEMVIT
jgi:hypothetical protein